MNTQPPPVKPLSRNPITRLITSLQQTVGWGKRLVIAVPMLWLILFFLIPFLVVFKISFGQTAIAIPPIAPILDWNADDAWDDAWNDAGNDARNDAWDAHAFNDGSARWNDAASRRHASQQLISSLWMNGKLGDSCIHDWKRCVVG